MKEIFKSHNEEYLQFASVENKRSTRSDLHAFILLDELVPGTTDMVSHTEHDEIWLGVDPEDVFKVATPAQVIELIRCGVRYDGECFKMFV